MSSPKLELIDGDKSSLYDNEAVTTYAANSIYENKTTTGSAVESEHQTSTRYEETRENIFAM